MTKARAKTQRLFIDQQRVFMLLGELELLPGDEVKLEDGVIGCYVGWLAGGHCFRVPEVPDFWWPKADAKGILVRSPNRERKAAQVEDVGEVDPLRDRRR